MNDSKAFTPGPWVVDHAQTRGHIKATSPALAPRTPTVARYDVLPDDLMPFEEKRANANLIAAAPDLYDIVQELDAWLEFRNDVASELGHTRVKIVLALARGEAAQPGSGSAETATAANASPATASTEGSE